METLCISTVESATTSLMI